MKLWQYQEQVSGIPTSLAPERTTTDKWQPNTNTPQSNWQKVALYSVAAVMPFTAFVNLGQPERSTPDKWQPDTNKPVFSVPRNQYLYPTFVVDGKQFTLSERITPDKWQPETNKPLFDVKRQQGTYPSFFFNSLPIEEPAFIQMAGIYQTPVPYLTVKHTEYLFPSFLTDANSLTQKEVTKVFSPQSIVLSQLRHTQYQGLAYVNKPTVTEIVTVDKWNHDTDRPVFDLKRQQQTFPGSFFNPLPIGTPAPFVSAAVYQSNVPYFPIKHGEYLYQNFGIDPAQLTQKERSTLDKWFKETERPLFDVRRTQQTYPSLSFNPFPLPNTEIVTTDKWHPNSNVPLFDVRRHQFLYPSSFIDAKVLTSKERATLDKWVPESNRPLFDLRRNQYLYQSFSIDASQLTLKETTKVFASQSVVLSFPRSTQYQALTFIDEGNLHEVINLDKWFKETQLPRFDVKRWQYLYPSFVVDALSVTRSEIAKVFTQDTLVLSYPRLTQYQGEAFTQRGIEKVNVDKWFRLIGQPLFDQKRQQFLYQTFGIDSRHLTDKETTKLDKWFKETQQPFFIPHNHGYIQYVFEPRRRLPTEYDDKYTPRSTNFSDKYSSRGSSYGDKYSSRGSTYNDKYSSRGSNYSDKYSQRNTPYNDKYPS